MEFYCGMHPTHFVIDADEQGNQVSSSTQIIKHEQDYHHEIINKTVDSHSK